VAPKVFERAKEKAVSLTAELVELAAAVELVAAVKPKDGDQKRSPRDTGTAVKGRGQRLEPWTGNAKDIWTGIQENSFEETSGHGFRKTASKRTSGHRVKPTEDVKFQ
jgi:hypothetical protein